MQKTIIVLISLFLITSCSDELSNSKAEKIINECLEGSPYRETVKFQYGRRTIFNRDKEEFSRLKEIEEKGFLKIDSIGIKKVRYYGKYTEYQIELTDKSKEYIVEQTEKDKKSYVEIKVFDYELDEVKETHEVPSLNIAEVRVNYRKINITPFVSLSKVNQTDFKIQKLTFRKTSNGWRYCD